MAKPLSLFLLGVIWASSLEASVAVRRGRRCPSIDLEFGRVRIKSRGRVAKFKCRKGYTMFEGDRFATCVRGMWNGKIPKCITPGCEYYSSIPHGEAVYLYNEALVQFLCDPGYALEGTPSLTCDGETWNGTTPECQAPLNPAKSCDFEGESLCGWMNDDLDHFDWIRNRGPTASFGVGTGPQVDHTLGTVDGHYMYIEASIPREEGDKARLYSPIYPASITDIPSCFAFYYHMFGNTTGQLNVYIKEDEEDMHLVPPIFQMSGYNNNKWILHVIHIDKKRTDFQIIIEGVRGPDYMSDIGIDDVRLAQGDDCVELDTECVNQYVTMSPDTTTVRTTDATTTSQLTSLPAIITTSPNSEVSPPLTTTQRPDGNVTDVTETMTATSFPEYSTINQTVPSSSSTVPSSSSSVIQTNQTTVNPSTIRVTETSVQTTLTPTHDSGDKYDLNSCRNRCGEIAVENDPCGCDMECWSNSSCCSDIEIFCHGYFSTPLPITPSPKSTTAVSTTTFYGTTTSQDMSKTEQQMNVTVTTTKIPDVTSEVTQKSTTEMTSEMPQITTTSASPTETTAVIVTMKSTKSDEVTNPSTKVTTISTTKDLQDTTTTTTTTTTPTTTTTATTESTEEITTSSTLTTPATTSEITKTTSTTTSSEKKSYSSTAAPSVEAGTEKHSGLSQTAVYIIAIGTTTAIILLVILTVIYIRKRRRDKLPEDSDIRFLARDEVMMEGNVFNLTGTITQARNAAI